MTVQDPPWRQRTRPCPFFSQGRCLFADSCNFLHDIKVKSPLDQSLVDVHVTQPVRPRVFSPPQTVLNLPSVVVNSASPRSTQLVSPVDDTSRYFGLLSVLQDVIGPSTHQDGETLATQPVDMNDIFLQNSQADTTVAGFSPDTSFTDISTLVERSDLCDTQDSSVMDVSGDAGEIQEILARHDSASDDYKEAKDRFPSYVVDDEDGAEKQEQDPEEAAEDKSQPVSMRFPTPPSRFSSMSTTSSVLSLLARPHDLMEVPLDSSGQEACNNLLSPVELSARLRPFSMYGYNFPPKREDSIDSGYADSWTGPALLARSPPHSTRNSITFDSTPFRRASISLLQDRRVSYDVRSVRPSPRQPVVAEQYDDDASSTSSILDAYNLSSDLDEPFSPTVRLTGMVVTPPLSPPAEPSSPKQPSVPFSESLPIHDNALEPSSLQPDSAPEGDTRHASFDTHSPLESVVSPLSSSTARPSSVNGIFPTQEAVLVGMKFCSLPPSPLPEPAASDAVHIVSRADDVITSSSVSSSVNDSEFMEGELSSMMSLLSLGTFPSGRSSPNTSILSVECDYMVDGMTQETVFSQPPSPRQNGLAPAQSPTSSSVWDDDNMDGSGLQEDQLYRNHLTEVRESSIARPGERPRISRELLAHIGHVFSLSDDMPVPAEDALDATGSGSDVQTNDHRDSWHDALNADVQQALRISSMSPVVFLSDDADFDHDEAGVRTSCNPQLGDFSVDLRRWSGAENVLSVEEGVSVSSVELDESDVLRGQPSTEGLLDDLVSLPAALGPPTGQAIGTCDIDALVLQGKWDIQTAHFHDQSLVDTSTINDSSAATFGSVDAPSIVEFVQRSRAISDATVKPDSRSPSAPCFPPSPVAFIPANLVDTDLDDHADFLQALDDRSVHAQLVDSPSMEATAVKLAHETGESQNLHPASVLESTVHDHKEKHSSVLVRTGPPAIWHRAPLNLTIRIPSTFEAQPSSSSTAQSLPLILSLSNGRDTKRWFSPNTDGFSSTANSPSASAPVTSNLPSREAGSTKVPFGFRRVNPQFVARRPLQSAQRSSSISPVFHPAARRESDAASASAAPQQLDFFPPNPLSTDRLLSPIELQHKSSTAGLKPLRLSNLLNPRSSVSSSSSIMSNILSDHVFNSSSPHSPNVSSSTSLSHNSLLPSPCLSSIPEHIPEHIHNTLTPAHDSSSSSLAFTLLLRLLFILCRGSVSCTLRQSNRLRLGAFRVTEEALVI
ncbi:hypothetical protein EV702DRAFT_375859 [Suillus placidus]|uniref:C3H1-type domain-containing protein n=1 Tax=Suillus placidus TaxID=48579 RepID=A0A9P7A600_9AGAM|nr:hypothetical protein EV702DRAFT_375859 [Suillus placidus]